MSGTAYGGSAFSGIAYIGTEDFSTSEINTSMYIKKGEAIDMNNKKITNCQEGTEEDDVCTIKNLAVYYKKGTSLDMKNTRITGVSDGTELSDACTIKQLREHTNTVTQDLQINNKKITGLANGTADKDATNLLQVKEFFQNYLYVISAQLNKRVTLSPDSTPGDQCYLIAKFDTTFDSVASKGMFSTWTCADASERKYCYATPKIIPLSLFIESNLRIDNNNRGRRWVQEPFIFAGSQVYFRDAMKILANTWFKFYFIALEDV